MHISSGGSKLQIARLQLSDGGTYTCVASNVEGKARKSYHLTIQGTHLYFKEYKFFKGFTKVYLVVLVFQIKLHYDLCLSSTKYHWIRHAQ